MRRLSRIVSSRINRMVLGRNRRAVLAHQELALAAQRHNNMSTGSLGHNNRDYVSQWRDNATEKINIVHGELNILLSGMRNWVRVETSQGRHNEAITREHETLIDVLIDLIRDLLEARDYIPNIQGPVETRQFGLMIHGLITELDVIANMEQSRGGQGNTNEQVLRGMVHRLNEISHYGLSASEIAALTQSNPAQHGLMIHNVPGSSGQHGPMIHNVPGSSGQHGPMIHNVPGSSGQHGPMIHNVPGSSGQHGSMIHNVPGSSGQHGPMIHNVPGSSGQR